VARCVGIKADGSRCERVVGASQTFCYSHDESRSQERSRNASKAARSKTDVDIGSVKRRLREVAEGVLDGSIDKGKGSVSFQGFGVLIRAIEVERKIREQEEILGRIEQLEQTSLQHKGGGRWGA
jgi:hypothetical protein